MFDLKSILLGVALAIVLPVTHNREAPNPFARSIQVAFDFPYYKDRSPESIASELKVNGFRCARLVVTSEATIDPKLVDALHREGMAVWYTTFGNGTYSTADFPKGWDAWRMQLKSKQANEVAAGFVHLCLNDPGYRAWKKAQVVATLKRIPFDGFEVAEPFWPGYRGVESDTYGCLCDDCRAAFLLMYPSETHIPEFLDEKSPRYYRTDRELYDKWVRFRVHSVASFLHEVINGPGGVRESCPKVRVAVWGIADDVTNPVETLREWEGIDGALLVKTVRPDQYVLQTDWPDWLNPELPPDYPLRYRPFVEAIRETGSKVPIILQADIGSNEKCRRSYAWMRRCEAAARKAGMAGVTAYEYHLGLDIYTAPPRLAMASGEDSTVTLAFTKRLDPASASNIGNYVVRPGRILDCDVDGSIVRLTVEGHPTEVTARNIRDDATRRFFKGHAQTMLTSQSRPIVWSE